MAHNNGSPMPYAAGVPSIGNPLMQYIPILYAGKTIKRYYETSIIPFISNTDYEGMIKAQGNEVRIRTVPEITIEDHAIGDVITNQRPLSESKTLLIDKAKRWSFIIDDIEQVQTDLKNRVTEWSQNAAENLDAHICTDVLTDLPAMVADANKGIAAGVRSSLINLGGAEVKGASHEFLKITAQNIMRKIVELGAVLDEQNVPDDGRWLLIDPLTAALLKASDIKSAELTGDVKSPYRSGLVGRVDRFTVFATNRLYRQLAFEDDGTTLAADSVENYFTNILFGNREGLTFATQLTKNKMQDDPNGFDYVYRGLQVYGYEVIKPHALGLLRAQPDFVGSTVSVNNG
jgi:hypothetical protein